VEGSVAIPIRGVGISSQLEKFHGQEMISAGDGNVEGSVAIELGLDTDIAAGIAHGRE